MVGEVPEWAAWMSPQSYQQFIRLCTGSITARGVRAGYDGDGTFRYEGGVTRVNGLARMLREEPTERWAQVVDAFIAEMLVTPERREEPIDPASVFLSCTQRAAVPEHCLSSVDEVLPGIVLIPAVDHPNRVEKIVADNERTRPLGGSAGMLDLGRRNLARAPFFQNHSVLSQNQPDSIVTLITAPDPYVAGRLGVLDTVIPDFARGTIGIVVAVPAQEAMLIHVIRGPGLVVALNAMVPFAVSHYESDPHPLTPQLFFIGPDGDTQQITRTDPDGMPAVLDQGPFSAALRAALG